MSDKDKTDDPHIIKEENLDDVQGGMKIPNIFSGEGKVVNSFDLADTTVTAKLGDEKLDTNWFSGHPEFPKVKK